eukprot:4987828-Amphidinium_carterae.1
MAAGIQRQSHAYNHWCKGLKLRSDYAKLISAIQIPERLEERLCTKVMHDSKTQANKPHAT